MLADKRAHTTLPTADLDRLRSWYEDILGFEAVRGPSRCGPVQTAVGSVFAISRGSVVSYQARHTQMAFTVDDIEAEVNRGSRHAASCSRRTRQPKTTGGIATIGAGGAAWFKDPTGTSC